MEMHVKVLYLVVFSNGDVLLYSKWPGDVEGIFVEGEHENNENKQSVEH